MTSIRSASVPSTQVMNWWNSHVKHKCAFCNGPAAVINEPQLFLRGVFVLRFNG